MMKSCSILYVQKENRYQQNCGLQNEQYTLPTEHSDRLIQERVVMKKAILQDGTGYFWRSPLTLFLPFKADCGEMVDGTSV